MTDISPSQPIISDDFAHSRATNWLLYIDYRLHLQTDAEFNHLTTRNDLAQI